MGEVISILCVVVLGSALGIYSCNNHWEMERVHGQCVLINKQLSDPVSFCDVQVYGSVQSNR